MSGTVLQTAIGGNTFSGTLTTKKAVFALGAHRIGNGPITFFGSNPGAPVNGDELYIGDNVVIPNVKLGGTASPQEWKTTAYLGSGKTFVRHDYVSLLSDFAIAGAASWTLLSLSAGEGGVLWSVVSKGSSTKSDASHGGALGDGTTLDLFGTSILDLNFDIRSYKNTLLNPVFWKTSAPYTIVLKADVNPAITFTAGTVSCAAHWSRFELI